MPTAVKSNLDFESTARIVNLPDAVSAQQPATFAQLQAAIEGLKQKDPVKVATQSNLDLSSPGATIDGQSMAVNDRVLVKANTTQAQNGLYIWNGAAVPMTRSADASTAAELNGALVPVALGTNAGTNWRQTATVVTLGTDAVTFTQFGTAASQATETSAGIAELATQAETDTGTDDQRIVTPLKLASYSGRAKRFAATFGDGSATQYDLTHNLGTTDVQVQVFVVSSGATVLCDVTRLSTTVVRLNFASAPASNTLRAVVTA